MTARGCRFRLFSFRPRKCICPPMRSCLFFASILVTVLPLASLLFGQTPPGSQSSPQAPGKTDLSPDEDPEANQDSESLSDKLMRSLNVPLKTAGGAQLWTDHVWRGGYRIQQHALTGHWRLVDANDVRRGWGTRELCEKTLDQLLPPPEPTTPPRHVVVLLHGLMRTHHSMKSLSESLQQAGFEDIVRFSYASTRTSITDHAAALRDVLNGFPPQTRFSFVGHSMGNIVVRRLIGELQSDGDPTQLLPRCQSMVMLGPPNQGAAIARRLAPTGLFGLVTGKGGLELGREWEDFVKKLAIPPFPFAIVAGDLSESPIQNPLIDGSGDFVVSLDEAKLERAEAFHKVPALHSFLMSDDAAKELTVEFLIAHRPADQEH